VDTPVAIGGNVSEAASVALEVSPIDLPPSNSNTHDMVVQCNSCEKFATEFSWISRLSTTRFFHPCSIHTDVKRNECNYFYSRSTNVPALCKHCVQQNQRSDSDGIFLQIRMYMYRYIVYLDDLSKYYDCSGIQSYTTNQRKAVLLHPKDDPSNIYGRSDFENQCLTCKVPIKPDFQYCSVHCKAAVPCSSSIPQNQQSLGTRGKQDSRGFQRKYRDFFKWWFLK